MTIPQITLAGKKVGKVGFGLMQLSWTPEIPPQETSFAAMKAAVDAGANAWSTALFYGNPGKHLDNIKLIAAFLDKYPQYKDEIVLVVKGGLAEDYHPTGSIDLLRSQLKEAQAILGDKEIDVVSFARIPPDSTVEEVAKTLVTLRDEGLFREIGASEVTAKSLEIFQKYAPVAIVEIEVSLWSYEQDIQDVIAWSNKNSVPIFAYSPLGRGFISRKWKTPEDVPKGSFQSMLPRFQGDNFYKNLKLVDELDVLAEKKGVKTTQLAIAWVAKIGTYAIPIPGSHNPERIQENVSSANIELSDADVDGIQKILDSFEIAGDRYPESHSGVLMK